MRFFAVHWKMIWIVWLSLVLPSASRGTTKGLNQPTALSVNFLTETSRVFQNGYVVNVPLSKAIQEEQTYQIASIGQKIPFFGWVVSSVQNNTLQTAYRLLLSSSAGSLAQDLGDLWDSGKISSDQSVNISYAGRELQPKTVYFWKVKTWDNHGKESAWSAVAQFATSSQLVAYETARYPLQKQDNFPVKVTQVNSSTTFLDFGKAAFGTLRLKLTAKVGADSITIHLGEAMKEGRINKAPGGTIRYSVYRLALKPGSHEYRIKIRADKRNTGPQAIHMPEYIGEVTPFRYCEIEGYNGKIAKDQVVQEAVFYPFNEDESHFSCSDTVLNKVWELCKYSIKATSFTGIYVDGDRERIPYEADAYINQLGHYGVTREFSMPRYSIEYLIHHPTWPTEWILQSVLMAWNDYLFTGNKESLNRFYKDLCAKSLLALADDQGFISTKTGKVTPEVLESIHFKGTLKDIVDWPQTGILGLGKNEPGETDGFVFREVNTVINAYHYQALILLSKMAELLGKLSDSDQFSKQAQKLKISFNAQLLDSARGVFRDGIGTDHASLHANLFPLAFGLVPENYRPKIAGFVQSRGLACSVYGSQFLMDAVYGAEMADYGLSLLTSTAERSWYNMIRVGSTISLEAWDNKYKPNLDWNHAWGAVPANIIPFKLMGIEPLEPGFRKIQIKPQTGLLQHAEMKYPTIRGVVFVSVDAKAGQSYSLKVTIPANTTADVYLPLFDDKQKITLDGKVISSEKSGAFCRVKEVGSGARSFLVTY